MFKMIKNSNLWKLFLVSSVLVLYFSCGQTGFPPELFTRAELTQYEETSLHADVMNFVNTLKKQSDIVHVEAMGTSLKGREIPLVVLSDPPVKTPEEALETGKMVVYIQGNIHAGEVEGKEASLELMREIVLGSKSYLLENQIILFSPIYNADGNDSLSESRRAGTTPFKAGTRASGEGYDLNRDGMKLDALETKALVGNVLLKWDPAVLVDLHTTNGSYHGYALTYAPSYHTAGHPGPSEYTMDVLLPAVTDKVLERSGLPMYLYGGFRGNPPTRWTTYNHHPRYVTNYMGLRNRIGILSETFRYDTFEKRIFSAKMFVLTILEYTNDHSEEINKVLIKATDETIGQALQNAGNFQKGVNFTMVALDEPFELLVRDTETIPSETGRRGQSRMTGMISRYPNVQNFNKFEPTKMSTFPRGYIFPAELQNVKEKLTEHGIIVTELLSESTFEGEEFTITSFSQGRNYEKHQLVSIEGTFNSATKTFPKGFYKVDLAQQLGNLAFYLLEPEADDGLVVWNFFGDYLIEQGVENGETAYPVFKYFNQQK
ncbi:M14 family metallopeptidase [candidate division KSB1 bacterium]